MLHVLYITGKNIFFVDNKAKRKLVTCAHHNNTSQLAAPQSGTSNNTSMTKTLAAKKFPLDPEGETL